MRLTNGIANGSLQRMLLGLVLVAITVAAAPFVANPASPNWTAPQPVPLLGWALWLVMMACAVATLRIYKQRLLAVLLVGGVGLMVALTFVFLSAPDLALTQLLVEMVTLVLMLLGMWAVLELGLVVTLLSGLLVFHLSHVLASTVEGRLPPGRARAMAVAVLSVAVIGLLGLAIIAVVSFFRNETGGPDALLAQLMEILNTSRHQVPPLLQPYIPEDMQALRAGVNEWVAEHRRQLGVAGTSAVQIGVRVLIGMVLGAMIALYDELPLPRMGPLARELVGRTSHLATAFRQVVFAQLKISLLNTLFTAIFLLGVLPLLGVHLPLAKTLVLITFLAGLLPVVGNVISNTVITIVALSVSFYVAVAALLFLVMIHKLEYFLNARIVGGEIRAHAWELLLAMLVMEAAFGLSGLVAAPVFYAYVKRELVAQGWV